MELLQVAAKLGALGIALLVILMLVDMVRKKYRESDPGDRRKVPFVVQCPNKVEGLDATLTSIQKQSAAQTVLLAECTQELRHNGDGISRLVAQHAPQGGRETWKIPPRMELLQEESRDLLRELVNEVKSNNGQRR